MEEELVKKIKKQLFKEIKSLKDKRGFIKAGFPKFGRLFGRDSLIVSWQLLDLDPQICKNTLGVLAQLQGKTIDNKKEEEPGKILHEHQIGLKKHPQGYFPFPYYGSVDSTPLFLVLFSFYFKKTKDKRFLEKYWNNILAATNWQIHYGDEDKDGFLEYQRKNPKGLFHQGWKDSGENHLKILPPVAIVEVQGYAYLALKEIANLSKILGNQILSKSLSERAKILKGAFNTRFWMSDKKYFALALDGQKKQKETITSNPGHLLFSGIIENDKVDALVKRLFAKDMWTSYGIRTHSTLEPDFDPQSYHLGSIWPHDNWVIAQGLKKLGYEKEYEKIKKAISKAYQEIGFIPELYGVIDGRLVEIEKACYPQAWATGAVLNFML